MTGTSRDGSTEDLLVGKKPVGKLRFMRRFLPVCRLTALCLFGLVPVLRAETSQELLDKIPALIHADAVAKKARGGPAAINANEETQRDNQFAQVRDMLASGNDNGAESFMQLVLGNDPSDALRTACQTLVPQYRKERLEKEAAISAEGEAAVQAACDQALKATAPKDLDAPRQALVQWLEKREDTRATPSARNDRTRQRVQGALNFINRWQDYLAARANGNDERSLNELLRTMLTGSGSEASLNLPIQRSAILALIKPDRSTNGNSAASKRTAGEIAVALDAALDRAKTLDDLPAAIKDVQAVRDDQAGGYNGTNSNDLNAALGALQTLYQTYLEFRAGLRTNLELMSSRYDISTRISGGIESHLVPLRAQLVALELPRLLGAPLTEKPNPGETLDVFWRRLLDAAKQRGDWAAVAQGLDVGRTLVFTGDPRGAEGYNRELDTTGFKSLLAAFNFESAGQYAQAVAAYLNALGSPVPDLPVALIGERLAALKKDHPKDYEIVTQTGYSVNEFGTRFPGRFQAQPITSEAAATPASSPTPTPTVTPAPVEPKATPAATPGK